MDTRSLEIEASPEAKPSPSPEKVVDWQANPDMVHARLWLPEGTVMFDESKKAHPEAWQPLDFARSGRTMVELAESYATDPENPASSEVMADNQQLIKELATAAYSVFDSERPVGKDGRLNFLALERGNVVQLDSEDRHRFRALDNGSVLLLHVDNEDNLQVQSKDADIDSPNMLEVLTARSQDSVNHAVFDRNHFRMDTLRGDNAQPAEVVARRFNLDQKYTQRRPIQPQNITESYGRDTAALPSSSEKRTIGSAAIHTRTNN